MDSSNQDSFIEIAEHLSLEEILEFRLVCKSFKNMIDTNNKLWARIIIRDYPIIKEKIHYFINLAKINNFELYKRCKIRVYCFGGNNCGAMGIDKFGTFSTPMELTSLRKITHVSTSTYHSAFISGGELFVCGWSNSGRLGFNCKKDNINIWIPIKIQCDNGSKNITHVSCGEHHTIVISDNKLFVCGLNNSSHLGFDIPETIYEPTIVPLALDITNILAIRKQLCETKYHHTAIISNGKLFMCGNNTYGQLGLGYTSADVSTFTEIKSLKNVTAVSCGYHHTVAISDGHLFVFGRNTEGQLGLGSYTDNVCTPTLNPLLENVTCISCGQYRTMVVADKELYLFGFNTGDDNMVKLGLDPKKMHYPQRIKGLRNVSHVSCGDVHAGVISDNKLYTFGYDQSGQLGIGSAIDHTQPVIFNTPSEIQLPIPSGFSSHNPFIYPINITCGHHHTMVLTLAIDIDNSDDKKIEN